VNGLAGEAVASVLVVDDSPANLVALGAVLKPLGVRVVEAISGENALECVAGEHFAVALVDVQMPGMDGFEVARRFRATPGAEELPVIFLTAIHRDEAYARKGYATGAADYITKPFDADVLRARVKAFVDLFQQRERLRLEQVGERTRERDVAMQRLAELLESERRARREAEIANRAKDEFLATVSHELRTPLNAILGWAVLAQRKTTEPHTKHALETIERNAHAQARIIEDVLDVARIINGDLRLEISQVRVADAIDGAVQTMRPAAEAKGVSLSISVDPDVDFVDADADRLQQVIWNLLSNAIKFTPKGGKVSLSAQHVRGEIVIRIADTGQGVRRDFLDHIFEPFRQADGSTTRRHGGLGLGLAIVDQLVRAHGGLIVANSDGEGRGATFTVSLPERAKARRIHRSGRPPSGTHAAVTESLSLEGVRILVVDDDEDGRSLLECVLVDHGAQVAGAPSAAVGMRELERFHPDLIVSDIGMPDVDGYAFIRRVRSLPAERGGRTPAIALTAYARAEDAERALATGFHAHVAKPVDTAHLLSLASRLARQRVGAMARTTGEA
jgi:signal transduction histidine kinase